MAQTTLVDALREEAGDLPPELSGEAIDRILTEPQQATLAEAVAADAVEAVPLIGDLMAIRRRQVADDMNMDYPDKAVYAEDFAGDLPTPVDLVAETLLVYQTPLYLERKYGIELRNPPQEAAERLSEATAGLLGAE